VCLACIADQSFTIHRRCAGDNGDNGTQRLLPHSFLCQCQRPPIPAVLSDKLAASAGEQFRPEIDLQIQRGDWVVRLQCPSPQCGALLHELR